MEKYWEHEITDLYEGMSFKFDKINPIDHINLVTFDTKGLSKDVDNGPDKASADFIKACFKYIKWNKGSGWFNVLDDNGNARLPELDEHPSLLLDLFIKFRTEVLLPVFIESKTFQDILQTK